MEQRLNCNVQECGSQLSERAVVTVCSHAICVQCANNHGFTEQAPYTCPVCGQALNASEVCEQLLHPPEEWKSVTLSGLSPTVVMECAGRALSFWSYQMTNQISYQARKNSKLREYCAELQGEIENIWGQANQRITTLTTRIRDMEREEQSLKRTCEDLRLTLEARTRELSQSQELYSKLKQRVLHSQNRGISPGILRSRTPLQGGPVVDGTGGHPQSQLPRPVMPAGIRSSASNYFPASPNCSKMQLTSTTLHDWNKPAGLSQQVPSTPSNNMSLRNPSTLAFPSTPRVGIGVAPVAPASGSFHQTTGHREVSATVGLRSSTEPRANLDSFRTLHGGNNSGLSRPTVGRAQVLQEPTRVSPRSAQNQRSQSFELSRPILRRP
ncbi:hypothetical protein VTK26DRAFT_8639 [Humicola hyalothermophila]